ncbi:MAG TPA: CHASE2 domain-containing protein [Caulobacteraceae bacterium]
MVLGRIFKALLVSLLLAASAYGVAKLNLFGLESASDELADGVYQRITAADYGADRRGQSQVSVVYLDESSMEAMKGFGWGHFPPTYEQQTQMYDDVLSVGGAPPSAVYADYVYTGEGGANEGWPAFLAEIAKATHADAWRGAPACQADPLTKIACIEASGGVPMIFAKPSPAEVDIFTDVQRQLDKVAVMSPALVNALAYPMVWRYPFDAAAARARGVDGFDISPALALYAAYCLHQADACGIADFAALRRRARAALAGKPLAPVDVTRTFDGPLSVVWGSRPDPDYLTMTRNVTGQDAPCRKPRGHWLVRLGEQMANLRGPGTDAHQECPYALTLGYDRIVAGLGLQQSDLKRLLAGKLVLLGGQFRASNDWVESPVQGEAPGVHFHAMAIDNLIEDGANYRRSSSQLIDSDLFKSLLIAGMAFCGVMGVMARNSLLDRAVETRAEAKLRARVYGPLYFGIFGASVGVVIAATLFGVRVLHRAPINWIGITAVVLGFLFYATRETLPADILGSVEHLRWVKRSMAAIRLFRQHLKFEEDRLVTRRTQRSATPAEGAEPAQPAPPAARNESPKEAPAHVQT